MGCQPGADGKLDHLFVQDGQNAGKAAANRTGIVVRRLTELCRTAAENLRLS